ncbi:MULTISPECIES: TlpA disulfide reductase family protein [unclassified Flavobacterium]|uniref:TlpA family protein disulfide reductase n=1 Tax=unclassified Flavobacterium TaxID=196869 RepID=UPI0012910DC0|nr:MULTISPECIES: TlpA disulfide reductase family protein [unclassified Flavobacterium]MQP51920.1 redoxin domain-containing protein [Flavobacterium sp. LMO9]MQP61789.1 redoxin domain-containing protein [Flavobacterium sp. LMO6]
MKKLALFLLFFGNIVYSQQEFPSVDLKTLDSETINTSSFNEADKLYVFSFWATWCAPCIQELEAISEVYQDWKTQINVEVIAVSTDDSRTQKRVKPLVNGKGWEYNVLLDTNQDLKRKLSIANIPYLIVVKNGKIVFIQNGHTPGAEEELLAKLKTL